MMERYENGWNEALAKPQDNQLLATRQQIKQKREKPLLESQHKQETDMQVMMKRYQRRWKEAMPKKAKEESVRHPNGMLQLTHKHLLHSEEPTAATVLRQAGVVKTTARDHEDSTAQQLAQQRRL